MKYLTCEEKKALALAGKDVPLCVKNHRSLNRNGYIAKIRSVWDGSLKKARIKL